MIKKKYVELPDGTIINFREILYIKKYLQDYKIVFTRGSTTTIDEEAFQIIKKCLHLSSHTYWKETFCYA